jgi:hypothetical protein
VTDPNIAARMILERCCQPLVAIDKGLVIMRVSRTDDPAAICDLWIRPLDARPICIPLDMNGAAEVRGILLEAHEVISDECASSDAQMCWSAVLDEVEATVDAIEPYMVVPKDMLN